MNRMSPGVRDVRRPTRSPGRSSTGPDVVRTFTPSSRAMSSASVVFPRPGGPKNSVWSRGSLRCFAASIAIWSDSLTLAWPTNSSSREGRNAASVTRSSGSASGVVIWVREGVVMTLGCSRHSLAVRRPLERLASRVRGAVGGRRRRPRARLKLAQLVGQFKREALRGLLADAAHRRQQCDVALLQRPRAPLHPQRGHQRDRELWPDAGDADEPLEKPPL